MHDSESKIERFALAFTRWIGSPGSILLHTILFSGTIALLIADIFSFNTVILIFNTAVSLEAIYLALFIQMTVNHTTAVVHEVGEDIDEIQEDIGEIQEDVGEITEDVGELQEDVDEIQKDVDELQEDVEEINEDDQAEEQAEAEHKRTLAAIHDDLHKLLIDIERLKNEERVQ